MNRRDNVNVLLAGGGVAALEAALALQELGEGRIRVELLSPDPVFWYRPAAVAEPFALGEVRHFELSKVAAAAGAAFTPGALVAVDAERHEARTSEGATLPYDALLVACGAVPKPAVPGALTFRGPADTDAFGALLAELEEGTVRQLAFAVPWGAVWALPLYELALMTGARMTARQVESAELSLVTPETRPLELFGRTASETVSDLLDERSIAVHTSCYPAAFEAGELLLIPEEAVPADRVVALPRLHGQRIDGIPQTLDGFVAVDEHGRVVGVDDVFAAGDITSFPVKQGGLAAQQAQAAAEAIAAWAGVELEPAPFRRVLRGLLLTGTGPRYLRRDLTEPGDSSWASEAPIWWPPAKIVGRRLAPFLANLAGIPLPTHEPVPDAAVPVEIELDSRDLDRLAGRALETRPTQAATGRTVGEVMNAEPIVAAPEDTLGELAERMRERDLASAIVADCGRVIGIVTARDLLRAFAGRVHPSEARVRQWMTAEPIVVGPGATGEAAALLMTEHAIHHLPVVENTRPVGMVGLRDVNRSRAAVERPAVGLGF